MKMKNYLIILFFLLIGLFSCKKKVERDNPEFIGYWSGGTFNEYGYVFLSINEKSRASFFISDYSNDHEYHSSGTARIVNNKLSLTPFTYFTIIEYPHKIDTNIERKYFTNFLTSRNKLANWKMVLNGLRGSSDCNVGNRTYYKADY